MTMTLTTPLIVTFIVYIAGMLFIGYMAYRSTNNFDDYYFGGRRMGSFADCIIRRCIRHERLAADGITGCFFSGISESRIAIGLCIGAGLNWRIVAGRLRLQTEVNHALTLPGLLYAAFEDKSRVLRDCLCSRDPGFSSPFTVLPASWPVVCCLKAPSVSVMKSHVASGQGNYCLYLPRRVPGGKLDRYRRRH